MTIAKERKKSAKLRVLVNDEESVNFCIELELARIDRINMGNIVDRYRQWEEDLEMIAYHKLMIEYLKIHPRETITREELTTMNAGAWDNIEDPSDD